jgi:glycosyltransferase involved in cell wall biosynthesis
MSERRKQHSLGHLFTDCIEDMSIINRQSGTQQPCVVAVDLHMLGAGGQNGGVKPAIYHLLGNIARRQAGRIAFKFLVNRCLAEEVATKFGANCVHVVQGFPNPSASRPGQRVPLRARWALRNADLLYAPLWFSPFHSAARPTVALMVDMLHRDHPEMLSGETERLWREEIISFAAETAWNVQTISQTMAGRIRDYYGVPSTELFTTYLPLQTRLRRHHDEGLSGHQRSAFLYPANLWPHKNHERLLAAYGLYRAAAGGAAWRLVLTGHQDAARKLELDKVIRKLRLPIECVQFAGFLGDNDYGRLWSDVGALIFPSLYEGFGMPLLEAMYFEVPIAASRVAAIPEIVGDAALLFDPLDPQAIADTMLQISSKPVLRKDLVRKGITRLLAFDADKEADRLAEVFLTAIDQYRACKGTKNL